MERELQAAFDDIEAQRIRLIGSVRTMTPAQQEFRPAEASWCVLDVIQHLVLSEEQFLAYGRKKASAAPEAPTLTSRALAAAVVAFMKSPLRVKAPVASVLPREVVPLADLAPRWEAARDGLRALVAGLPRERLGKVLFKHPVAGKITALSGLEFFFAHVGHYLGQIARIKEAPGFPRA